ncbi:monoglyceride lipase [[Candida] railenensis]|uniref:Monoglyceride lipase n=1 Tax=[Candida] railenensis TaxID=45579 RepID=A0A9P0QSR6_9ASCO|nr:monoglyceride lipase [[Candida] railenensis]
MSSLPYTIQDKSRISESLVTHDNINFCTVSISPPKNTLVKGKMMFIHGFSEHAGMYYKLMETFSDQGYECFTFDQRGSGKTSLGKYRGRVGRTKEKIYTDVDKMMEVAWFADEKEVQVPLVLVGHSMGGGIALSYGVKGKYRNRISDIIVTGPLIQLHESITPHPIIVYILSTIASWFPNLAYATLEGPTRVTSSEPWKEYLAEEVLCRGTGTLGQLNNMISRGSDLLYGDISTINPKLRILLLHADNDSVTSIKASEKFIDRVDLPKENKKFLKVKNACHSLFIEDDVVYDNVIESINAFLN